VRRAAILISILSLATALSCRHSGVVERPVAISYADMVRQLPDSLRRPGDTLGYPNSFSPQTKISYTVEVSSLVTVVLYNVLGQPVVTLVNEWQRRGEYEVPIPDVATNGKPLSSGMYFARVTTAKSEMTKKVMILR
jgi:hypothetical protein